MSKEQIYQAKIIKAIESKGGVVVNGNFTKAGIADLICGYPTGERTILRHLHVEVKTEYDYNRVMRSVYEDKGYYCFKEDTKSLKEHEYLQIIKLNKVRKAGGWALVAYSFEQVEEYINENK